MRKTEWSFVNKIVVIVGLLLMMICMTSLTVSAAETVELLEQDIVWKYYDNEADPVINGERTAWTKEEFNLSEFKTVPENMEAKFGAKKGKLAEVDSYMPTVLLNQYKEGTTTNIEAFFFRATVNIESIHEEDYLTGELLYDDAALVYLNGQLIAEFSNKQKADSTKKFDANMQYGGHGSDVTKGVFVVPSSYLREGDNILAVEIHQVSAGSSDVYFEMKSLTLGEAEGVQKAESLTVGKDEASRNVTWYCNIPTPGKIQYAEKSGNNFPEQYLEVIAEMESSSDSGYFINKGELKNLKPDTEYVYRLVNDETVSEIHGFKTTGEGTFSFLAVGDPQIGAGSVAADAENFGVTLQKALDKYPETAFLVSAGDQVNKDSSENQYEAFLEQVMDSSLPVAAAIGNHDSDSEIYSQHFNNPNETLYGRTDAGTNYWFVYNNVLFMHLNSNSESVAEHREFIKEAVEKNKDVNWKIVAFHHSIYSAAGHALQSSILERREKYVPVFEEFDIDMVLMGHDHVYVRSYIMEGFDAVVSEENSVINPKGILYMTLNSSSGSKYYNLSGEYEYAAVQSQEKIPSISCVQVSDKELKITTHRIDNEFSVLDEFSIYHKNDIKKKKVTLSAESYIYNGKERKPEITIKGLTENTDYKVRYKNNKYPGKASVIITGIEDYTGTIEKTFIIKPKAVTGLSAKLTAHDDVKVSWNKVTGATGYKIYFKRSIKDTYTYAGRTTKTYWNKKNLMDGYKYNFKIVPYMTIDGKRVNASSKTVNLYTLKKMSRPSVSRTGAKLKVKWKSMNGVSGYQISRSSKKNGTYIVATVGKKDILSKKVTAVKGKKYYIKVRAYKVVDGVKIKGPWSEARVYVR